MKIKSFILLSFVLLLSFSCKKEVKSEGETLDEDTLTILIQAEDSLVIETPDVSDVWEGVYSGILPCEDCDGAETVIELSFDSTFTQNVTYIGRGGPYESRGTFTREAENLVLNFDDGSRAVYKVQAGTLSLLDEAGEEIGGEAYMLRK